MVTGDDEAMKHIYILLSRSTTIASRCIHFATKKEYTHCSISVDPHLEEMYAFCRIYPRLPIPGGLARDSIQLGFYKIHSKIPCAYYRLEVTDVQYEMVKEALRRLWEIKDRFSYDLLGAGLFLSKKERKCFNKRYCSWFLSELLGTLGIATFTKPYSQVEPIDMKDIEGIELLFEGSVENLRTYLKECYNNDGNEE